MKDAADCRTVTDTTKAPDQLHRKRGARVDKMIESTIDFLLET